MRAGIDRREQKKKAAEFEADMLRKARAAMGLATDTIESQAADRARALAADIYEGADMRVRTVGGAVWGRWDKSTLRHAPVACFVHRDRQVLRARVGPRCADVVVRLRAAQVEKHWTEKALDEMTERDWRIFREDYNISYKGSNTCLPMRNWLEGNFPEPVMRVRAWVRGWVDSRAGAPRLWQLEEGGGDAQA